MRQDDKRKQIIARAIIDPGFRQQLFASPEKVFEVKTLDEEDLAALTWIRKMLPAMDDMVSAMAGDILCGGGGGCGGLA